MHGDPRRGDVPSYTDRTGSIAVDKEADLQVVRGAPDQDIGDIDNVEIVFANGVVYDPALLLSKLKGW